MIRACANKKTGALRLAKKCRRSERSVAWNQAGPQGRQGPPGVPGAQGTPGRSGTYATVNGVAAGGALTGTYPNPQLAGSEDWHEVSEFGVCHVVPNTNWENAGGALATAAYYRDRLGIVRLKGSVTCPGGKAGIGYTIFTLPPGYRPDAVEYFTAPTGAGTAAKFSEVTVDQLGPVTYSGPALETGEHLSLDGVSFRCAPRGSDGCP